MNYSYACYLLQIPVVRKPEKELCDNNELLDIFIENSYHLAGFKSQLSRKISLSTMKRVKAFLCLAGLLLMSGLEAADSLDKTIEEGVKATEESRQAQAAIDKYADDASLMLQEYRSTLDQVDSLKIYNQQLEKLIATQAETLKSISSQMDGVEDTQHNIVPLMLRMIEGLEKFIALDLPFLLDERQARLDAIKTMMDRPDVTLPDKFRRIMEAYQIEIEYGRTIGTNTATILIDGENHTVDILQVGRIALLYQTLDGQKSGYWDNTSKTWKDLGGDYNPSIKKGIQIAREQASPDFFKVPVSAVEKAQ